LFGVTTQFQLRNEAVDYNLDVRAGDTADGTLLVLFSPHTMPNQRFVFRPRGEEFVEIAPASTLGSCVTEVGEEVRITACSPTDDLQEWELLAESCN
jgi:hypothetical protein